MTTDYTSSSREVNGVATFTCLGGYSFVSQTPPADYVALPDKSATCYHFPEIPFLDWMWSDFGTDMGDCTGTD